MLWWDMGSEKLGTTELDHGINRSLLSLDVYCPTGIALMIFFFMNSVIATYQE